jgi:GTP-binding protein YchF
MNLEIGIIGLPNVGKSTLFNALVGEQQAQVANFPFCTIEPNVAVVPVPDKRLDKLAEVVGVSKKIPATIRFVDVAGLIKGASQGEGLGNQFLGNIRNVHAILHVVRCFDDPNVLHISDKPNPRSEIEIIKTELALADLHQLDKKIEKLTRQIKGDSKLIPLLEMAQAVRGHLATGKPLREFQELTSPLFTDLNKELMLLSAKKTIYIANVGEEDLTMGNPYLTAVEETASLEGAQVISICADLEQGMASFSESEREEYLEISGISGSSLSKVISASYALLGLISYFTFNESEARAWTIQKGWKAPRAAGEIHTDFEHGFIRAEVASFDKFIERGSWAALKKSGESRSEGSGYVVEDGDVILFRFNV